MWAINFERVIMQMYISELLHYIKTKELKKWNQE